MPPLRPDPTLPHPVTCNPSTTNVQPVATSAPAGLAPPPPRSLPQSNSQSHIRNPPSLPLTGHQIYPSSYHPFSYAYGSQPIGPGMVPLYYPLQVNHSAATPQRHPLPNSAASQISLGGLVNTMPNPAPPTPSRSSLAKRPLDAAESTRTPAPKRSCLAPTTVPPLSQEPTVYGVGPIVSPSRPAAVPSTSTYPAALPTQTTPSEGPKTNGHPPYAAVWFFFRALEVKKQPETLPTNEPILNSKPTTPYVGCKFCRAWRPFSIQNNSMTTLRRHLRKEHLDMYKGMLNMFGSTDPQMEAESRPMPAPEPFSKQGFVDRLLRWVVVDDQSINVVDCPEFRDLLLYISEQLTDQDIPHRTKLTQEILATFDIERAKLKQDLKNSLGRISFTSDLWSDPNLASYMAVTAHYIGKNDDGHLCLRSSLVAFKHVVGAHTGDELAKHFVSILKELEITDRIGMITLDNASNNNTMMEAIAVALKQLGIPFDSVGNRIRCFPHVINIAVQAILKALGIKISAALLARISPNQPITVDNPYASAINRTQYETALQSEPLARCRDIISFCRASGQRRAELQQTIKDGNNSHIFNKPVPEVQLLRDCPTRWSSTYLLAKRFLELHEAIRLFLIRPKQTNSGQVMLDHAQLSVLHDITCILEVPHTAQEALSSERTPTLANALPAYELLITAWCELGKQYPLLKHAIDAGLAKIMEYVDKTRLTRIYTLAMILNPEFGLTYLERNWNNSDYEAAKKILFETMMDFCKGMQTSVASRNTTNLQAQSRASVGPATQASNSVRNAFNKLRSFSRQSSSSTLSLSSSEDPDSTKTTEELLAEATQRNCQLVEKEIANYYAVEEYSVPNLVAYWENNSLKFPILYRIALDVLPAQASAVPCERVFSSSKDTSTLKRANLSPELMTALQLLKFSYRTRRLDFTSDWIATEEEFRIDNITPSLIEELMTAGKFSELEELLTPLQGVVLADV